MQLAYPFHFDARLRTAEASEDDHVRDMIEQILFTQAGERVNRPTFGSGVMQLVFAAASPDMAATTEFLIRGALQQWLADRVSVSGVSVTASDARLDIQIDYLVLATGRRGSATFPWETGT